MLRLGSEEDVPWLEAERRTFGIDHCGVGRWVVDEWRLPDELHEVVVHHHDERAFDRSMVSLVALASDIANIVLPHPMEGLDWHEPEEALAALPLDRKRALAAVETALERIKTELG